MKGRPNLLLHHNIVRGMGCVDCVPCWGHKGKVTPVMKRHRHSVFLRGSRTLRDCPPYLSFLPAPKPLACDANQKQPAPRKKCPAVQLLRLIIALGAFSAAADVVSSHFLLAFK